MSLRRSTSPLGAAIIFLAIVSFTGNSNAAPDPIWKNLSSKRGENR